MASIRERVLDWIVERPHLDFTVNRVAVDLGLTRRQALNALHGMSRNGLSEQLVNLGGGLWQYNPPRTVVQVLQNPEALPKVPIGYSGTFEVVARFGEWHIIRDSRGPGETPVYLWAKVIPEITFDAEEAVRFLEG